MLKVWNIQGGELPMSSDFFSQILITVVLIPLITSLSEYFKSRREKRHRFDEHRLGAYSAFARSIAEILWSPDSAEAANRRAKAWVFFEDISLTSSAEVVASAVRVRYAASSWVDQMKIAESEGVVFQPVSQNNSESYTRVKAFHTAHTNSVYRELSEFHRLARSNMGLPSLNSQIVEDEIRKYYDY
jgi:hypothetical protein